MLVALRLVARNHLRSVICPSFSVRVARHLLVQRPYVYAKYDPNKWGEKYPRLGRLLTAETYRKEKTEVHSVMDKLTSKGGAHVTSFSKHPSEKYDIYTMNITVKLADDVYVETWRNGAGGAMTSRCRGKYKMKDVNTVRLMFSKKESVEFKYREDHSKWAVGMKRPYFCTSSLNRMESQFHRGGGVLCLKSASLAKLFRYSVEDTVPCNVK